jgi:beta-glucosidase
MSKNKKMSNKVFLGIWIPVLAVTTGIIVGANVAAGVYGAALDFTFGKGEVIKTPLEGTENWNKTYYSQSFDSSAKSRKNGENKVEDICNEGIVMLKNDGTLPLSTSSEITLLGRGSVDPIYGGSGSGNVDTTTCANPKSGLEKAGFSIDSGAYKFFQDNVASFDKANIVMDKYDQSYFFIGEIPSSKYSFTVKNSNAAIVFISRAGGEGGDLSTDLVRDSKTSAAQKKIKDNANTANEVKNYAEGQHQLELSKEEKDMITFAENNYSKVVVVVNSSNVMELGELNKDEKVNGIFWVGSMGSTGFNSLGNILSGKVNPSGHTPDIYPADLTKDPSFKNFGLNGVNTYEGISGSDDILVGDGNTYGAHFVQYEEGIYVGYRYYETAAKEGYINYDTSVVYPFGYGLSYTTFTKEIVSSSTFGDDVSVEVKVTNTGSKEGKEVVQLYYSAPYTKGGIEKSSTVLGDFAKTKTLKSGESETLKLTIKKEEMASYDYKNEKAYVLDKGEYVYQIKENSHEISKDSSGKNLEFKSNEEKKVFKNGKSSDKTAVTNQFDDVSAIFKDTEQKGYALNMSRSDFKTTFPTEPTSDDANIDVTLGEFGTIRSGLKPYANKNDSNDVMPTTGASNGLSLIDLRGIDYDDKSWDLLLDQLTDKEYKDSTTYLANNAYNTAEMVSVGKPATIDHDGPQGFSVLFGAKPDACAYMSEPLLAATFNVELAKEMGIAVGEEALALGYHGWYGPAMNTHRSAFAGRNFEYYSEDGILGGKIASAVVSGAADKGVFAYIKHFALNDQEYMRTTNLCTWANEQAIREIYLRPFEICVKNAKTTINYISDENGTMSNKEINATTAMMSSFNRIGTTWAGGYKNLMTNVLRDEWNFHGAVISDFNLYGYMPSDQGMRAGTDMQLTWTKTFADTDSATSRIALRKAYHNLFYMIANSNAMQGIAPGTIISYTLSGWQIGLISGTVVLSTALTAGVVWVICRTIKNSKKED